STFPLTLTSTFPSTSASTSTFPSTLTLTLTSTLKQKYSPPSAKIFKLAENITAMSLGTKLRHMRTQKNLSQMQVAQELDVSQTAYNKWESDQSKPGIDNLLKISQFYEMDVYELLNESAGDKIFNNNFYENASVVGRYSTHNHLSERLVEQYEARIKALEEQVA